MDDVYNNIDDYNPKRKRKILIVFDDMIADIMTNKKFQEVRLNSTHYVIFKVNNERELQNIAINHIADIDYKDFLKIYSNCTNEPFSFLTINTTLPSSNILKFRKNSLILLYKK